MKFGQFVDKKSTRSAESARTSKPVPAVPALKNVCLRL